MILKIMKVLGHPVTLFNGLLVGFLIIVGLAHNHAHYTMELDADSYVRGWCKKNQDICRRYSTPDDY
jgi:hypothetical protein